MNNETVNIPNTPINVQTERGRPPAASRHETSRQSTGTGKPSAHEAPLPSARQSDLVEKEGLIVFRHVDIEDFQAAIDSEREGRLASILSEPISGGR